MGMDGIWNRARGLNREGLWDLFFPPACIGCGKVLLERARFCFDCDLVLDPLPPGCERCAEPGDFEVCPRCEVRPPPFDRAWAPYVHGGPIARAVHLLKYEDRPELARELGALVVEQSGEFLEGAGMDVIPIPLHLWRYVARRYDQAALLASEIAARSGRRLLARALTRVKRTRRQVGQDERTREANVRGAFVADASCVHGRRVLLVDDVLTTGATARAAASALIKAGAKEVQVLTVARAWTA